MPNLDRFIEQRHKSVADIREVIKRLGTAPDQRPTLKHEAATHDFGQEKRDFLAQLFATLGIGTVLPPAPKDAEGPIPQSVRLLELREILWADTSFWKLIFADAPADSIAEFVRRSYHLEFDPVPAVVWRELSKAPPPKRDEFWKLLVMDFVSAEGTGYQELRDKLPVDLMGKLLWRYLRNPQRDQLHLLASQQLSADALSKLRKAAAA
jgi:hypothetical protein